MTVAEGRVIPSKQVQVTQSLEGGIVKSIAVREGERVKADQILMTLDDTRAKAELNELNIESASLKLKLERLRAEADDQAFEVNAHMRQESDADTIKRQQQLYRSRKREYANLVKQKEYAEKELQMSLPLAKKGVVSDVEILHLQKSVSELEHKIDNFNTETLKEYREAAVNLSK